MDFWSQFKAVHAFSVPMKISEDFEIIRKVSVEMHKRSVKMILI